MPLPREVREKLDELILKHDGSESFESLLRRCAEELGDDGVHCRRLLETYQETRLLEAAKAQEVWFGALAWWLAKVLMWTSLFAAVLGVVWIGPRAVDGLTWALVGAAGYYICIQLLTPARLKRERQRLYQVLEQHRRQVRETSDRPSTPSGS